MYSTTVTSEYNTSELMRSFFQKPKRWPVNKEYQKELYTKRDKAQCTDVWAENNTREILDGSEKFDAFLKITTIKNHDDSDPGIKL